MCPHATTTTVAFLYGEHDDDLGHASHVASCGDCTAVVEQHEAVATALAGVLPALRTVRTPAVRARSRWPLALAAAALLALALGWWSRPSPAPPTVLARGPSPDRFDADLDALDLDVASLELEML